MGEKIKKSKASFPSSAKTVKPEEKIMAVRKTLVDMKEHLLTEGLGKSLSDNLDASLDIGDEGDRAGNESLRDVSILLSARNKEKLLAVEEALEKIREGTYGMCEECGEEIGGGRLKVMPLAKSCVTCQSRLEKETAHQKFAEGKLDQSLIGEAEGEVTE